VTTASNQLIETLVKIGLQIRREELSSHTENTCLAIDQHSVCRRLQLNVNEYSTSLQMTTLYFFTFDPVQYRFRTNCLLRSERTPHFYSIFTLRCYSAQVTILIMIILIVVNFIRIKYVFDKY
jgi:hypothetical protein